jgi:hypothetical protein
MAEPEAMAARWVTEDSVVRAATVRMGTRQFRAEGAVLVDWAASESTGVWAELEAMAEMVAQHMVLPGPMRLLHQPLEMAGMGATEPMAEREARVEPGAMRWVASMAVAGQAALAEMQVFRAMVATAGTAALSFRMGEMGEMAEIPAWLAMAAWADLWERAARAAPQGRMVPMALPQPAAAMAAMAAMAARDFPQ